MILTIKPQVLRFKQVKNGKLALKNGFKMCSQFSFTYCGLLANYLEPQIFISHLKNLKYLKHLTLDLAFLLQIPKHFICKILTSFKSLKGLAVLHFELKYVSSLVRESNLQSLCQALSILNDLSRVQVRFSLSALEMNHREALGLNLLLRSLSQLERFTSANLTFRSSADITPILVATETFKASRSLTKFSLTFEKCKINPFSRLKELFLTLKEIQLLRYSEILFKECDVPEYASLKTIIPSIETVSQNQHISIIFENYRHTMSTYERLMFLKSVQNIESPHEVQVQFIENFRIAKKLKSSCHDCGSRMIKRLTSCRKNILVLYIFVILSVIAFLGFGIALPLVLTRDC